MHMVVDAEDDDVVLPHEVDLRFVERVIPDDRHVVAIIPVGVFVRDDHVQPRGTGTLDDIERAEHGRRDAFDLDLRAAEFEGVAIGGIAPRHAEILLDAIDDVRRGHQAGLQYGSPAATCRIGTSGTNVFSQLAQTSIPGSSETTRPTRIKRLPVAGEHFVARVLGRLPLADLARDECINRRERLQGRLNRRRSGEQADALHPGLRIADDTDAAARVQALPHVFHQPVERERGDLHAERITDGFAFRPAKRRRDAERARVRLAEPPVIGQAKDDEPVPGDEVVLGGEDRIRGLGRRRSSEADLSRRSWRRTWDAW